MGNALEPAKALGPERVRSAYLGALGLETLEGRLRAAETVLSLGRLGLRPSELLHLHAGWIDWEQGELRVPEQDPCACAHCWERARVAQRDGDHRPLADILAEDHWRGRARSIPFGWAPRLTGLLATAVDAWEYLDLTAEDLRRLLAASAQRATAVERADLDVSTLRASAAAFYADAGFDAPRLADVMGIKVETAAAFTAQEPGRVRSHLYRTFDAEPPAVAGEGQRYPLLVGTDPLENEPFDPSEYDADWRARRAAAADDPPGRSPRPGIEPENAGAWSGEVSIPDEEDAAEDPHGSTTVEDEVASETTDVSSSATERAAAADGSSAEPEAAENPAAAKSAAAAPESGSTDGEDAGTSGPDRADIDDLASLATEPLALDFATRFAGATILGGQPAGGRVLLGAAELVIGAHGGGQLRAVDVVDYDDVRDVAVDWAPDRLESIFGETLGLSIERGGERVTLVLEIPEDLRVICIRRLFEALLGDCGATVRHPARVGGHVTDEAPVHGTLSVDEDRLSVEDAGDVDPTIGLADVIGVERETVTDGGGVHHGLRVTHLADDGRTIGTFLAPTGERDRRLLERYLVADYRDRQERAAEADLDEHQREVLDALETRRGRRDLAKLLGKEPETLASLLDALSGSGFLHSTDDGVRLTGLGRLASTSVESDADA